MESRRSVAFCFIRFSVFNFMNWSCRFGFSLDCFLQLEFRWIVSCQFCFSLNCFFTLEFRWIVSCQFGFKKSTHVYFLVQARKIFTGAFSVASQLKNPRLTGVITPNVMSVGDDSHFAFPKRRNFYYRREAYPCLRKMRIYCAAVSLRLRLRSKGFAFHELFLKENLAAACMRLICKIPRALWVGGTDPLMWAWRCCILL